MCVLEYPSLIECIICKNIIDTLKNFLYYKIHVNIQYKLFVTQTFKMNSNEPKYF